VKDYLQVNWELVFLTQLALHATPPPHIAIHLTNSKLALMEHVNIWRSLEIHASQTTLVALEIVKMGSVKDNLSEKNVYHNFISLRDIANLVCIVSLLSFQV
jgi:hypothetical protein